MFQNKLINYVISFFRKKNISLIIIIYCSYAQSLLAHAIKKSDYYINKISKPIDNDQYLKKKYKTIHIESDITQMYYPEKIEFFGNVLIKQNKNVIETDKLTIYHSNNVLNTKLYAEGNVIYRNKNIVLTGLYAEFNLNNKNLDLHQGTYYISKPHIYGTANIIMQRNNNRYTIVKKGCFTSCISNDNHWNIVGSTIMFDCLNNNIHIWNACLKINKIPLFYSPYLLLFMNIDKKLSFCIPYIKYSSQSGLILKIPLPLIFSKNYSSAITPYYISNFGIGLNTKILYNIMVGTGVLKFNIMQDNIKNNKSNYLQNSKLYWKHYGIINKKWKFNIDYLFKNNFKKCTENINNKYSKFIKDYINQKAKCSYSNKHYKISIAYLGKLNSYKKNIVQNNCSYSVAPQLEMYFFSNYMQKKSLNFQIFNQFSRFIPTNDKYPDSIRIHTEPIINFTINNSWIRYNTETKLKITHYQQNNINYYNIKHKQHKKYLQNKVMRIIPQFKIEGKMIFQKKTNTIKKNKYFLEPKLQYLYIPYFFQENIGIYDTKAIYINHSNLFHGTKYSGLDRIAAANQITGNITVRCLNKKNDKFNIAVGQILNLIDSNKIIDNSNFKKKSCISAIIPKIELCASGMGYWRINNYWTIYSEMQYNTTIQELSFGNAILEYINEKNVTFQTNYRYVNTKYFQKDYLDNTPLTKNRTISQLGITTYCPLKNNWIISCSHYYNIKSNTLIEQTIGIQRLTPCCSFSVMYEHSIIDWQNKLHINSYENKIQFHLNLFDIQSSVHKILGSKMIPYQRILTNI